MTISLAGVGIEAYGTVRNPEDAIADTDNTDNTEDE